LRRRRRRCSRRSTDSSCCSRAAPRRRSRRRHSVSTASLCGWRGPSESVGRRTHVLDLLAQRLATAPLRALAAGRARSDAAEGRARHALAIARARLAGRIDAAAVRLEALAPERVLGRGYALLIGADGKPITTVARLAVGSRVAARLADGAADLVTTAVSSRQAGH